MVDPFPHSPSVFVCVCVCVYSAYSTVLWSYSTVFSHWVYAYKNEEALLLLMLNYYMW